MASTGSGQTTSHTYDEAGTYTISLTVTDDDGATNSTTRQVTVTAPPAGTALAEDAFSRTVSNGWGSADTGGTWTLSTATSNFSVGNGVGRMTMATSSGPSAYLNSVAGQDVDLITNVSYDKPGTGGGVYTSAVVRRIGTSDYRAKLRVTATATSIILSRTVSGAETALVTQTVPGVVVAAGDVLNIRLQAEGDGTTTLRAKVWRSGTTEPATWTATATDTTAALQAPGGVGLQNYLSGSATNAPIVASIGDFQVVPLP